MAERLAKVTFATEDLHEVKGLIRTGLPEYIYIYIIWPNGPGLAAFGHVLQAIVDGMDPQHTHTIEECGIYLIALAASRQKCWSPEEK